MLQAVVGNEDIDVRMRFDQRLRRRDAVRADEYRRVRAPRDQQRFVADLLGGEACRDARRLGDLRAVTARDHAGLESGGAQRLDERDDGRRLARSADGHVAHDDHRRAHFDALHPAEVVEGAPRGSDRAEDAREGVSAHATGPRRRHSRARKFSSGGLKSDMDRLRDERWRAASRVRHGVQQQLLG